MPKNASASAPDTRPPVGSLLRECRIQVGWTQQRLAERADCSVAMIRALEAGYLPKGGAVVDRIAVALDEAEKGNA